MTDEEGRVLHKKIEDQMHVIDDLVGSREAAWKEIDSLNETIKTMQNAANADPRIEKMRVEMDAQSQTIKFLAAEKEAYRERSQLNSDHITKLNRDLAARDETIEQLKKDCESTLLAEADSEIIRLNAIAEERAAQIERLNTRIIDLELQNETNRTLVSRLREYEKEYSRYKDESYMKSRHADEYRRANNAMVDAKKIEMHAKSIVQILRNGVYNID